MRFSSTASWPGPAARSSCRPAPRRPARKLTVIGDIACDPTSDFSPIKVYDRATDWDAPALRVHDAPPLDVMAIDNLPSLMPVESRRIMRRSFCPSLLTLGAWQGRLGRAKGRVRQAQRGL
jgi:saccharopine dehydrogenase (NAD+, L-lysine-forming)